MRLFGPIEFDEAPMITTPVGWAGFVKVGLPVASGPIRLPETWLLIEAAPRSPRPARRLAEIRLFWMRLPGAPFMKTPYDPLGAGARPVRVVPTRFPMMTLPV